MWRQRRRGRASSLHHPGLLKSQGPAAQKQTLEEEGDFRDSQCRLCRLPTQLLGHNLKNLKVSISSSCPVGLWSQTDLGSKPVSALECWLMGALRAVRCALPGWALAVPLGLAPDITESSRRLLQPFPLASCCPEGAHLAANQALTNFLISGTSFHLGAWD